MGRTLCEYLSEKIWRPCGMQSDAYWQLESPDGQEFAGSGISATLRDYARFGMFVLADGVVDGRRLLPEGWMAQATAAVPGSRLAPGGRLQDFERSVMATSSGRSPTQAPAASSARWASSASRSMSMSTRKS